jgi:hypothetical protein
VTARTFRPEQARIIADAFERHGVEYLFIGKGAAILLGYPGATQDVALFPRKSPENGRRIVAALREIGFSLTDADQADIIAGRDFVQIRAGPFDVDLVFAPDGIESYAAAARDARAHREFSRDVHCRHHREQTIGRQEKGSGGTRAAGAIPQGVRAVAADPGGPARVNRVPAVWIGPAQTRVC